MYIIYYGNILKNVKVNRVACHALITLKIFLNILLNFKMCSVEPPTVVVILCQRRSSLFQRICKKTIHFLHLIPRRFYRKNKPEFHGFSNSFLYRRYTGCCFSLGEIRNHNNHMYKMMYYFSATCGVTSCEYSSQIVPRRR